MKKTKRVIRRGGGSHHLYIPQPEAEPFPVCQHPTRTELCADYGAFINTGIAPARFQLAKSCERCWFQVQMITMNR